MEKFLQRKIVSERFARAFDREEASRKIFEFSVSEKAFTEAQNVYIFLSTEKEPDTDSIIEHALKRGKKIYCPKIDGTKMSFHPFIPGEYSVGAYGIREPNSNAAAPPPDVIFVPLVAFDGNMNRLGHGKGYYDRFLEGSNAVKIGLAFSFQELNEVEVGSHDVPLDLIITETGARRGNDKM